jgi:hypothetical protein
MNAEQGKVYVTFFSICLYFVPALFLSYLYSRIVWKLWHPEKHLAGATSHQSTRNFVRKSRRKTTMMLLTVVLVLFLSFLPYNIFLLVFSYRDFDGFILQANAAGRVLSFIGSTSNPIIYSFFSQKFRTGFRNILSCSYDTQ